MDSADDTLMFESRSSTATWCGGILSAMSIWPVWSAATRAAASGMTRHTRVSTLGASGR